MDSKVAADYLMYKLLSHLNFLCLLLYVVVLSRKVTISGTYIPREICTFELYTVDLSKVPVKTSA